MARFSSARWITERLLNRIEIETPAAIGATNASAIELRQQDPAAANPPVSSNASEQIDPEEIARMGSIHMLPLHQRFGDSIDPEVRQQQAERGHHRQPVRSRAE